jgi:hypothetical protein
MVSARSGSATPAALSACEAGDDDAEQRDDGVNNGLACGGDGINNGHDAVADCTEDGLDLEGCQYGYWWDRGGVERRRTHDTTAPILTVGGVCRGSV